MGNSGEQSFFQGGTVACGGSACAICLECHEHKYTTSSYHLHHVLLSSTTENLDQLPGKNETNFHSFMVS